MISLIKEYAWLNIMIIILNTSSCGNKSKKTNYDHSSVDQPSPLINKKIVSSVKKNSGSEVHISKELSNLKTIIKNNFKRSPKINLQPNLDLSVNPKDNQNKINKEELSIKIKKEESAFIKEVKNLGQIIKLSNSIDKKPNINLQPNFDLTMGPLDGRETALQNYNINSNQILPPKKYNFNQTSQVFPKLDKTISISIIPQIELDIPETIPNKIEMDYIGYKILESLHFSYTKKSKENIKNLEIPLKLSFKVIKSKLLNHIPNNNKVESKNIKIDIQNTPILIYDSSIKSGIYIKMHIGNNNDFVEISDHNNLKKEIKFNLTYPSDKFITLIKQHNKDDFNFKLKDLLQRYFDNKNLNIEEELKKNTSDMHLLTQYFLNIINEITFKIEFYPQSKNIKTVKSQKLISTLKKSYYKLESKKLELEFITFSSQN